MKNESEEKIYKMEYRVFSSVQLVEGFILKSSTIIKYLNYKNKCRALFALFQEVLAECLAHKIMMLYSLLATYIIISSFTSIPIFHKQGLCDM